MLTPQCNFCHTPLVGAYQPINTRRGMRVFCCAGCGLIQSIPTQVYLSHPPPSMSCDADRASVKYTKDIISEDHVLLLAQHAGLAEARDCADIGANRGSMLRRWLELPSVGSVLAVESDPELVAQYAPDPRLQAVPQRVEDVDLGENRFDLVYCAHTLEHLRSARAFLYALRRALRPNGRAFLAVPNILTYPSDGFVELFIDTHTFHFSPAVLHRMIHSAGLEIIFSDTDNHHSEIQLVVMKSAAPVPTGANLGLRAEAESAQAFMDNYQLTLAANRALIFKMVAGLRTYLAGKPAIFWGAGRIFDSLIKIGGLESSLVTVLVDKYLHRYLDQVHGIPVAAPSTLDALPRSTPVVICSDDYQADIRREAGELGFTHSYHYKSTL